MGRVVVNLSDSIEAISLLERAHKLFGFLPKSWMLVSQTVHRNGWAGATVQVTYESDSIEEDVEVQVVERKRNSNGDLFVVMNPGERGISVDQFVANVSKLGRIIYG